MMAKGRLHRRAPRLAGIVPVAGLAALLLAWQSPPPAPPAATPSPTPTVPQQQHPTEVRLMTHDAFALSPEVLGLFEQEHGVPIVTLDNLGDTILMVNQAILAADDPLADVLYGVDNTILSRPVQAGIFDAYHAAGVDAVPSALRLDPDERVTPIDYGDVCVNLDLAAFRPGGLPTPMRLEDLTRLELKGKLVVENPAKSSPGLAFLLATIVRFGETGAYTWRDYWTDLDANEVLVSDSWTDAYELRFSGGAGQGDRPLVVSYASSPAAEVYYAAAPPPGPPTAALLDGCFRQVEFAAVLAHTPELELARQLVDFLLSQRVQEDIPLNMFVWPALPTAVVPDAFSRYSTQPSQPLSMDQATIAAGRERWIREWTDIVLH